MGLGVFGEICADLVVNYAVVDFCTAVKMAAGRQLDGLVVSLPFGIGTTMPCFRCWGTKLVPRLEFMIWSNPLLIPKYPS